MSQQIERALLDLLLEYHPGTLSMEEVVRYLTVGSDEPSEQDTIRVAARELVQVGLACQVGPFLTPTLAAVRFRALFC